MSVPAPETGVVTTPENLFKNIGVLMNQGKLRQSELGTEYQLFINRPHPHDPEQSQYFEFKIEKDDKNDPVKPFNVINEANFSGWTFTFSEGKKSLKFKINGGQVVVVNSEDGGIPYTNKPARQVFQHKMDIEEMMQLLDEETEKALESN